MSAGLKAPLKTVWLVEFSLAENLPAGSTVIGTIYTAGRAAGGSQTENVPMSEVDHIIAIKSAGVVSGGVDGDISLFVNGFDQPPVGSVSQSDVSVTNGQGLVLNPTVVLQKGDKFQVRLRTYAAMGDSAATQQIFLEVIRYPVA